MEDRMQLFCLKTFEMDVYISKLHQIFLNFLVFSNGHKDSHTSEGQKLNSVNHTLLKNLMQVQFEKHHLALPKEGVLRGGKVVSAFITDC